MLRYRNIIDCHLHNMFYNNRPSKAKQNKHGKSFGKNDNI